MFSQLLKLIPRVEFEPLGRNRPTPAARSNPSLRDEFMAEAQALDRPASQEVRDLMREFVRRASTTRSCTARWRQAAKDMRAGRGRTHAEVETDFAARLAQLLRKAGEAGA